jgi:site-specific recombinase XerD
MLNSLAFQDGMVPKTGTKKFIVMSSIDANGRQLLYRCRGNCTVRYATLSAYAEDLHQFEEDLSKREKRECLLINKTSYSDYSDAFD